MEGHGTSHVCMVSVRVRVIIRARVRGRGRGRFGVIIRVRVRVRGELLSTTSHVIFYSKGYVSTTITRLVRCDNRVHYTSIGIQ